MFSACNKNDDKISWQPIREDIYLNGTLQWVNYYEYDNMQRIKKITNTSAANTTQEYVYDYYNDSVIINADGIRATYILNNAGLATSAVLNFLLNPDGIRLNYAFSYDANGYLIQEEVIFSQVSNGALLSDTSFRNYTIRNGNIIKQSGTQQPDLNLEYNQMPSKGYTYEFWLQPGPFLGKASVNLISATKDNTGQIGATYDYDLELRGRMRSKIVRTPEPSSMLIKYVYYYAD